jgi:beta-galactosidase
MVTFPSRSLILIGLFTLFVNQYLFGQVIFRAVPDYQIRATDSLFFDITATRSIISLNGKWSVKPAHDENAPEVTISVPSIFEGEGEFIFEKEFELTQRQIIRNVIDLIFFSINYTTDISLNNVIIYRHSGGEYPFRIELPRDILLSDKKNLLSVKLSYKLDSKNTIPQKQRFLFPQNYGGIVGDVFLHLKPDVYISKESINKNISNNFKSASLEIGSLLKTAKLSQFSVSDEFEFSLRTTLRNDSGEVLNVLPDYKFKLERNRDINISQDIRIATPIFWLPENPDSYILNFELFADDSLIDVTRKSIALFNIFSDTGSIKLNGNDLAVKGVTYYPSNGIYGKLLTYDQMERDIGLIKETGFNAIRFARSTVHPYYLRLCEKYGLFAFLEIPISGVPSAIADDPSFVNRSKDFLLNYISFYR